jgi:toxin ParE1/3/4
VAKVELARRARADLDEIWWHIAQDSVREADRTIDRIVQRIQTLADFPELGPARPVIAPDARMLTVGNYLILYRKLSDRVQIVRIVHGARRLQSVWPGDGSDSG